MLGNAAHAASALELLPSGSKAATANATGSWISVAAYEENMIVIQNVGAITGSLTGKIQHADDASGTNAADVTGAAFTSSAAAGTKSLVINTNGLKPFIRYIGTIVTGPAVCSVMALGTLKY